jgi:HEPN domain-containing protein
MRWDEQAERLRRKADQDQQTATILAAVPSAADEVIGFHAQQAVEKMLKALLSHRRVAFRRTHDLTELIDLLIGDGVSVPPEIDVVRRLGPYAAEFRYEDIPVGQPERLDRAFVIECVQRTRTWVDQFFGRH